MEHQPAKTSKNLSPVFEQLLADMVAAARASFQGNLKSIVLFGSGAEGRLRPTSDLNVLFILTAFAPDQAASFREPLRVAQVAGRVTGMFVLVSELPHVAEAFAVKFDDIARRQRILFGEDLIAGLTTSRAALQQRLRQVLLNLILRMRERYLVASLNEQQAAIVIAEAAGPLRSAAATLLELEGVRVASPKAAMEQVARMLPDPGVLAAVEQLSIIRESRALPAGTGPQLIFQLLSLAEAMRARADRVT